MINEQSNVINQVTSEISKSEDSDHEAAPKVSTLKEPKAYLEVLMKYKVDKCSAQNSHQTESDTRICNSYHSTKDRRRAPFKNSVLVYNNEICTHIKDQNQCPEEDLWTYSHNQYEVDFHPCNFKIHECTKENQDDWFLGIHCPYVHSNEIKRDLSPYLEANKILLKPDSGCWISATKSDSFPKFNSSNRIPKQQKKYQKSVTIPFKGPNQPRYSMHYKNVSYSPLQGYYHGQGYKKYSSDFKVGEYFENWDTNYKGSLPNDSWHYQIQLQQTNTSADHKFKTLELDLSTFKTEKCTIENKHNPKHCKYYHSLKDRRRGNHTYSTDLCRFAETDKCLKGDKWPLSHSNVERLYHPDKYKTKFCDTFGHDVTKCEYGNYCSFAHVLSEIKIDLIHKLPKDATFYMYYFKTEWWPFRKDHHKADWVYAHNWQDFRRKPNLFPYQRTKCENWRSARYITKYSEGCVHMENCVHSHGWKEEFYHPLAYKVHPCREK